MPESIKSVLKMARSSSHKSPSSVNTSSRSEYFSDINNGDSTTLLSSPRVQFNSSVVQLQSPIRAASFDQNDKVYEKVDEVISGNHQGLIEPSISQRVDVTTPAKKGVACFSVTTTSKASRSADEGDDMMILPTSARNIFKETLFEASLENTAVDVEKQLEEEFVAKLHRLHPPLPPPLFMLQSKKQLNDEHKKQLNDDKSLLLAEVTVNPVMPIDNERTVQVQETMFIKEEAKSSSMTNESMLDEKKPVNHSIQEKEDLVKIQTRPQVLKLKIGLRINK
jgi:hypothetical protein